MKHLLPFSCFLMLSTACTPKPTAENPDAVKTAYVHSYGVEVADHTDWKERGSSGTTVQKLRDGSTLTEHWNEGKQHGLSVRTFPHTERPFIEAFYKDGVLLWKTEHYPSGMPKQQESFSCGGKEIATWYEDGTPKSHETYNDPFLTKASYFTQDQQIETLIDRGSGIRTLRDGFGQLIQKELFANGSLTIVYTFYANGMPQSETPYDLQGVVSGLKKNYTPAGEPLSFEEWQAGKRQGTTTLFENGEKVAEVPYNNDQKEGREKRFSPQAGVVVETITWKQGVKHGPRVLTVDGEEITEWYFDGEKVTRMQFRTRN